MVAGHQNQKLYFYKLLELPEHPQPDAIYLIAGDNDTYTMYVTDNTGHVRDQRTKVIIISESAFNTLVNTNSLVPGELWFVQELGRLCVPTSPNQFASFFSIYIGTTAPSDTSVIWFDISDQ